MEVMFHLVQISGEKIADMTKYEDAIFDIVARCTKEEETTVGTGWFSLTKVPALDEILAIERKLVELGLVIEA